MDEKQVRAIAKGKVQGVWFRRSTLEQAERLALKGTVRNLPDGSVEIVARGPARDVDALLAWARRGPPAASVDALEVTEMTLDPALGPFEISHQG